MNSDLTFITNENGKNLKERFSKLIKDTSFFNFSSAVIPDPH